jgi:hypothetical protein
LPLRGYGEDDVGRAPLPGNTSHVGLLKGHPMEWVLIVALVWLVVGLLLGIPLARAIRFADEDEDALTGWVPSDPPAPTAVPRERPAGPRPLPRRPRPDRPSPEDPEPGSPA